MRERSHALRPSGQDDLDRLHREASPPVAASRPIGLDPWSPALRATYARLPAGEESETAGAAIGVAYTPQVRAVWDVAGAARRERAFGASSVFIAPVGGIQWRAWTDVSESVEMWIPPALLRELSRQAGGPARPTLGYVEAVRDPVIVSVAAAVRAAAVGTAPVDRLRLEELATHLGAHVLSTYGGIRIPQDDGSPPPLDGPTLQALDAFIDEHLGRAITLRELAAIARRDLYHFARAFRRAAGAPPHAYVTARRMERALVLLHQTALPVREVARRVGYAKVGHFRRQFARAWGVASCEFRRAGRPAREARGSA